MDILLCLSVDFSQIFVNRLICKNKVQNIFSSSYRELMILYRERFSSSKLDVSVLVTVGSA